jgi:hypothetical protein
VSKTSGKGLTGPNDLSSGRDETQLKTTFQLPILGVKKNPQSPLYTSLGVLTKGTILEVNVSELGLVIEFGCMSARPDTGSYRASLRWVTLALVIRWRG